MEFRKTVESDIDSIMNIFNQAKAYMKEQGIDQWNNNYPNYEVVKNDIKDGVSYVLVKDNNVVGTVVAIFGEEKNYKNIYDGKWISNEEYAVIHRIAIDSNYKGLGIVSIIFKNIEDICINRSINSIRVDTHEDNLSMQSLLAKNCFQYCGVIYLEDKSKRIAFEKIL
ncbi:GNAT family N-acetyltransferase [Tissierella carlieri]|uniref:GNAT family N-acetyltransferase n=1 Tax=Tissierella carlieri TaxID=689904 RepID=UPI001C10FA6D|nr:GNAT family N-acetyltransferase [Tissierella carlieri]MBU5312169.1 GNAT family N-acetyltransferase [Tissierella carlieri]